MIVGRRRVAAATLAAAAALAACAPTLDWRDVRDPQGRWTAQLPCKPVTVTRDVVLGSQTVAMTLLACEAGGITWGLATADVREPARVGPALALLRPSVGERLTQVQPVAAAASWAPPGATPQPAAGTWHGRGRTPDGRTLEVYSAAASRGTVLLLATAMGETLPQQARAEFVASARFTP